MDSPIVVARPHSGHDPLHDAGAGGVYCVHRAIRESLQSVMPLFGSACDLCVCGVCVRVRAQAGSVYYVHACACVCLCLQHESFVPYKRKRAWESENVWQLTFEAHKCTCKQDKDRDGNANRRRNAGAEEEEVETATETESARRTACTHTHMHTHTCKHAHAHTHASLSHTCISPTHIPAPLACTAECN